jgi:hypothetical protein
MVCTSLGWSLLAADGHWPRDMGDISQPPDCMLYILFDVCGDYFSTSRMCSTSCTSGLYLRVWGWVGRYAGGGLVRVVRSFFRPTRPQKRLGKAQTPTRLVDCRKLIALDLQAIDACEIRFSARIIELLVYLSASDKVRAHRFFVLSMPL